MGQSVRCVGRDNVKGWLLGSGPTISTNERVDPEPVSSEHEPMRSIGQQLSNQYVFTLNWFLHKTAKTKMGSYLACQANRKFEAPLLCIQHFRQYQGFNNGF